MTAARSRPRVEPRLQARRQAVARREGLRRLWIVFGLTVVASLAIGGIAASNSSLLDIEAVEVVGADRADPSHIATAAGLVIGEPLASIDTTGVATRVASVPWVDEARVERDWRGTVTIHVTERTGVVALPVGGRFAIVDRTGQQLEVVPSRPDGYWSIVGVEASGVPGQPVDERGLVVVDVVEQLTPPVAEATDRIVVAEGGDVLLELSAGGRANLGDGRSLPEKFVALETMLARVDLTCVELVDVRVPSAPTVRRLDLRGAGEEPDSDTGGC